MAWTSPAVMRIGRPESMARIGYGDQNDANTIARVNPHIGDERGRQSLDRWVAGPRRTRDRRRHPEDADDDEGPGIGLTGQGVGLIDRPPENR